LTVAWVALRNQLIREVLEAWSLVGFRHVFFEWKKSIIVPQGLKNLKYFFLSGDSV
jgi:hypothetical protein